MNLRIEDYAGCHRSWVVGSQVLAERSQSEARPGLLVAYTEDDETAKDSPQRWGIDGEQTCQFRCSHGPGAKLTFPPISRPR